MRLIFMGTPEFSVPVLDALYAAGHDIAAVYSQPPRPAGRGKQLKKSPVHERAEALGLEVQTPLNFKAESDLAQFASYKADAAIVVAYGLILPRLILDAPQHGCINIHASLLPRWRGAAPIHRAIMAGDRETGVCIMQMEEGLDTGPVLLKETLTISKNETTGALHDRLSQCGAALCVQALSKLNTLTPAPQPQEGITYAHKIDKCEARIDWDQDAQTLSQQINGLSPFPGAWCLFGEERVKLLNAEAVEMSISAPIKDKERLLLPCKTGAISVIKLQRAGKKPLAIKDALSGINLSKSIT